MLLVVSILFVVIVAAFALWQQYTNTDPIVTIPDTEPAHAECTRPILAPVVR